MEDKIREAAYRIWEKEGCPHGKDDEHWAMAEVIVVKECGCKKAKKSPAKKKIVAKKVATAKKKVAKAKKKVITKKVVAKKKK